MKILNLNWHLGWGFLNLHPIEMIHIFKLLGFNFLQHIKHRWNPTV